MGWLLQRKGVTPVLRTGGLDAVGGSGVGYRDSREQKNDPRDVTQAYVDRQCRRFHKVLYSGMVYETSEEPVLQ